MAKKAAKTARPTIVNRRAQHDYLFLETYEAGIVLTGTEIKSIREGKVQLLDAFCAFQGPHLVLRNAEISPYKEGSYNNHEPKRTRILLLHEKELRKLRSRLQERGLTVVPVKLFFNERNFAKLVIALAKGKKDFDKRETLKTRTVEREQRRGDH